MVTGQWRSDNIQGETLSISRIPGSISKIQRFQGTVCRVREVEILRRLLNNQPSQVYQAISEAQKRLIEQVEKGLSGLHWKDFEILVDLIFRNVGWRRVSTLGEQMKDWDMALRDPITGDQYLVQVKSAATVDDFEKCAEKFSSESFRKFYFVVHSPEEKLASYQGIMGESVELILPKRLAHMVVDFGLTNWLLNKIR